LETDMKRGRFPEEQIIGVLREQEAGLKTADLCCKPGISEATFYAWKAKYGGLGVSEAKRLKTLEDENGRLKRLLAEAMLDNAVLKDLATKSTDARGQAGGGGPCPGGARDQPAAGVFAARCRPDVDPLPSPAS
jgi:putative transposase